MQKKILRTTLKGVFGELFKQPWPLASPGQSGVELPFDFRYANSKIGKDAAQKLVDMFRQSTMIVNLDLSGIGKSHVLTQLAVQKKAYVLYYDCGKLRSLEDKIEGLIIQEPLNSIEDYEQLAMKLERLLYSHTLAHTLALLHQIKTHQVEPVHFLRYLETTACTTLPFVTERLLKILNMTSMKDLKQQAIDEIRSLTNLNVVEAWDEAATLTEWAENMIPFSKSVRNKVSEIDPSGKKHLINGGSAFTVACRIAADDASFTIFSGTALRLLDVETNVCGSLKLGRVKFTTDSKMLRPWNSIQVSASLKEDFKINQKISPDTLANIEYNLQGRARLTSKFKMALYKLLRAEPKMDLDVAFNR